MKKFPEDIRFKYPWRSYQQQVLDELDTHLEDNQLHVIAPPGSGKTVLGLEVMLRLNKSTLILAPTIAIRNQWVERFCELFLQVDRKPNWISSDIRNPGFITVATYQGLHAFCSDDKIVEDEYDEADDENEEESGAAKSILKDRFEELVDSLNALDLGTIIVDEAHHLKNEWWKTLIEIKNRLSPTIVGLTATPPYDVSYIEWSRYIELNGPVDAEISVPELVKEGDLCPHQDYVVFSDPTKEELEHIHEYRRQVREAFRVLSKDENILENILNSALIKNPEEHLDWIYSNMEYYSSILIYLNHNDVKLKGFHFKITGNKQSQLPKLNHEWLEVFLDFYLARFENTNAAIEAHKDEVAKLLRKSGVMVHGKAKFTRDDKIEKFLTASVGKLESIKKITQFESAKLGMQLRQVILSDYIRKEYLSGTVTLNKMGVVPIFETLRRDNGQNLKLGMLTGSLVIIPQSARNLLIEFGQQTGITSIDFKLLDYDPDFLILKMNDRLRHDIVHMVTQVFQAGGINILVGTKSLLGEGWDAPSINVLILASFVGSFVSSNQMRGRAIRALRTDTEKTGNIWHLVCHDPTDPKGGKDLETLHRRFRSFVGISEREQRTIENGLQRLVLPQELGPSTTAVFNNKMFVSAGERQKLKNQWHEAIQNGTNLVEEIKVPYQDPVSFREKKEFYLNKTTKYVFYELGVGLTMYGENFLYKLPRYRNLLSTNEGLWTLLTTFLVGVLIFFGGRLFNAARLYLKYRDISKDLDAIGHSLLHTLISCGHIKTDQAALQIKTSVNEYGEIFCHLEGGTTFERSTFIKSLQEIIGPVDSPRYLIIRKGMFLNLFTQKDYHAVPEALGKHKSLAEKLEANWRSFVGMCRLVFTRSPEGRALLLKARFNSLASEFQEKSERTNRWK